MCDHKFLVALNRKIAITVIILCLKFVDYGENSNNMDNERAK